MSNKKTTGAQFFSKFTRKYSNSNKVICKRGKNLSKNLYQQDEKIQKNKINCKSSPRIQIIHIHIS